MDLDKYTSEMAKSVWDKAFFMDKIPGAKCVIDFGCADGAMIRFLAPLFPDITFIGYDISEELIDRACKASPYHANAVFFDNHDNHGDYHIKEFIRNKGFTSEDLCLNFSCVLHEVFSVTSEGKNVIRFLVNALEPKYITVRDMYFEGKNDVLSYYYVNEVVKAFNINKEAIVDFEDEFCSIGTLKGMHHFLMKYQWYNNGWDKEMAENYFSWEKGDLMDLIGPYSTIFETHYFLPYYREKWYEHEMYPLEANTHAQFIFRRW